MVGKINTNIRIRKGAQWNGMENTGRYGSTGKGIAQHGYCSDGSQDTLTKNQIDSIYHRAKKTKHISRESIGRQIITLLNEVTKRV